MCGCLHVAKAIANPVMVGNMSVSQQELEGRHTSPEIKDSQLVYDLLMELMTAFSDVEFHV